jgi:Tol biopolymer transport system component
MQGQRQARPVLQSAFSEQWGVFSPDGRWVAYHSEESGRSEIYVQPYPGPGSRVQISTEGGFQPTWARNGRELFYRNGDKMTVVSVQTQPDFKAGTPKTLFEAHYDFADYDLAADGKHFLMLKGDDEAAPTQLHVVMNWLEDWNPSSKKTVSPRQ